VRGKKEGRGEEGMGRGKDRREGERGKTEEGKAKKGKGGEDPLDLLLPEKFPSYAIARDVNLQ